MLFYVIHQGTYNFLVYISFELEYLLKGPTIATRTASKWGGVLIKLLHFGVSRFLKYDFRAAKNNNAQQVCKALFSLYRKIRNLDLPIDCQLKLFDSTIVPILTYRRGSLVLQ